MTTEEQLASKLESIRDSIVGFKFATDALEVRANKFELDLADLRARNAELSNAAIVVNEQLRAFNKSMDAQTADIRAVRNSVLAAILAATVLQVSSAAFTAMSTNRQPITAAGRSA